MRRRIRDAEGSCGTCAGLLKNDRTPSSCILRRMTAGMECWSRARASLSICTALRAASQGRQVSSYARPAIAPPATSVVACTILGVCLRSPPGRLSATGVCSKNSWESVFVSIAHRRVTSKMAKNTAKPALRARA